MVKSLSNSKFDVIMEAVKRILQADTDTIMFVLQKRIPEVVRTSVDKQVAEIKRNPMLENEKRMRGSNILSANVSDVLKRREHLLNVKARNQAMSGRRTKEATDQYRRVHYACILTCWYSCRRCRESMRRCETVY